MSSYGAAALAPAYGIFRDEICEISFVPSKTRYCRKGRGKDRSDGKTMKKT